MPEYSRNTRQNDYHFDPTRGRRLKYHAAYAANPEFDNAADPQLVPVNQTYENSPLVSGYEDGEGFSGGHSNSGRGLKRAFAHAGRSIDLANDPGLQDEFLQGIGAVSAERVASAGGVIRHSAGLEEEMTRIAGMNPTTLHNDGESGGYSSATDRYQDGSPGMGDEYPPDERDPHDKRPFVQARRPRPSVSAAPSPAKLRAMANRLLDRADRAEASGRMGEARIHERKAERIIAYLEKPRTRTASRPVAPPRPMSRRAGFQEYEDMPEDNFRVSSGFAEYQEEE